MDHRRTAYRRILCRIGEFSSCIQNITDYFPVISLSYSYKIEILAGLECLQTVDRSRFPDMHPVSNKSCGGKLIVSPGLVNLK